MDLCLPSGNSTVWNILVWCNCLKTWFKLEPKWPTQKIQEWKIYFILSFTVEGNTGGQKPCFPMCIRAKYQNGHFFKMRLCFYAYIFNEVPVFVRNFNLCWVIAQPLALLGLRSLGTNDIFLVHAVGKIFMRLNSCLDFIWSCISVIQQRD